MIDYYDNNDASVWMYDLFYMMYHFHKKHGNASGQILYSYILVDDEFVKITPHIAKFEIASVDPYTIFSMIAGEGVGDKTKTQRINLLFKILNEHCIYGDTCLNEEVLPQFSELNHRRVCTVPFYKKERSLDQQKEIWNIFSIIHDKDVPVAAFSNDIYERCHDKFTGCNFFQFTIFLHHACCEYFEALTKENREFHYKRGIKNITYKWYADQIGYHERNCEAMEEVKNHYLLLI